MQQYFVGANFIFITKTVHYTEMLAAKLTQVPPVVEKLNPIKTKNKN